MRLTRVSIPSAPGPAIPVGGWNMTWNAGFFKLAVHRERTTSCWHSGP